LKNGGWVTLDEAAKSPGLQVDRCHKIPTWLIKQKYGSISHSTSNYVLLLSYVCAWACAN